MGNGGGASDEHGNESEEPSLVPDRPSWLHRFAVALGVGVLVLALSVLASWGHWRNDFADYDPQAMTKGLIDLHAAVIDIQLAEGMAPAESLALVDLYAYRNERAYMSYMMDKVTAFVSKEEWDKDFWGRPLHYEQEGQAFRIWSLGADGKEGGTGYATDLVAGVPLDATARASFSDFLFEQPSSGLIDTCALSAFLAGLASLILQRRSMRKGLVALLIVDVGCATFMAVALAGIHIPFLSGH